MTTKPVKLSIDFVTEIAHPWCVINLITLERALQALRNEVTVDFEFQPFELAPKLGPEGETLAEGMGRRQEWTRAEVQINEAQAEARCRALGIAFMGNADRRVWNTFDAHRLLRWAGREQKARALFLALADAGCNRGENLSSHEVLARIAGESGLDSARALELLGSEEFKNEVRVIEVHYRAISVFRVPTLVINGRHRINDAIPYDQMVAGLRQIAALPS